MFKAIIMVPLAIAVTAKIIDLWQAEEPFNAKFEIKNKIDRYEEKL